MRDPFIDLTLLVLLVLFFGIQQRNRPESYFRTWLAGWLYILGSVAMWQWGQNHGSSSAVLECARLDLLVLGGLFFNISFVSMRRQDKRTLSFGVLISVWACLAIDTTIIHGRFSFLPIIPIVLGTISAVVAVSTLIPMAERKLRGALAAACILFGVSMSWFVIHGGLSYIPNFVLCEIFLCAGLLFVTLKGKDYIGRLLGTVGFFAWSASYIIATLPQFAFADPLLYSVWNVPKHFVGFGMILILFGTSRDEARDLGRKYKSLYEECRLLFESNPHPMWVYEPGTGRFLSVNESAVTQYGYSRAEFLKMTILDIRPPDDKARVLEAMAKGESSQKESWRHLRKDGSLFDVSVTAHDILFEGKPARFVLAIDISDREALHRQLQYRAQHDGLTDLPNRSVLEERIPQAIASAARDGNKVAIFTLDLDRFKQINDTFGHLAGDECLEEIARRLRSRIRQCDMIARTGGEEFTAVIGGLADPSSAEKVAKNILDLFVDPVKTSEQEIRVSVSIGAALYPDDGESAHTLRKRSDQALYYAKRMGGNQTVFANEAVYAPIERARTIEASLRQALRNNDFHLVYQPIFDRERRLAYFEALVRSNHTLLAAAGPAVFIPIAEDCGLVASLGRWALEESCKQLRDWSQQGLNVRPVAVNVSAKQLARSEFLSMVISTLNRYEVPRSLLTMELTETTLMGDQHTVTEMMTALSNAGITFAIDDFGTGYSSLSRLNGLPIASLKIDRSFVERIETESARAIVLAVIQISKSLNLKVVAEGVETDEQYRMLCDFGCDLFQGYLFSEPVHADQAAELLHVKQSHLIDALA